MSSNRPNKRKRKKLNIYITTSHKLSVHLQFPADSGKAVVHGHPALPQERGAHSVGGGEGGEPGPPAHRHQEASEQAKQQQQEEETGHK